MMEKNFQSNDSQVKGLSKPNSLVFNFLEMLTTYWQEEIVNLKMGDSLANLLNYLLDMYVFERKDFTCKNMKSYDFDPREVMRSLLTIYSNFYDCKPFKEMIVKDERSYKFALFEETCKKIDRKEIFIASFFGSRFRLLTKSLMQVEKEVKEHEVNYDDAPDEFIDPITSILMEDPVMLPTSKVIVDRSTIGD